MMSIYYCFKKKLRYRYFFLGFQLLLKQKNKKTQRGPQFGIKFRKNYIYNIFLYFLIIFYISSLMGKMGGNKKFNTKINK